ncbi:MAG: hypothetical protein MJ170_02940 [Alphaproteobacteria bacterium]|nr:hypothetical protein [Alphaproteobacteria bacterium]
MNLKIQSRQILPAVINLKQYSNDTYRLQFTLDTTDYDSVNLADLIPYAITSINDVIDETMLTKSFDQDGNLVVTWDVMNYSTSQIGHVDYQIMFKDTDHAVWYSLKAMMIVSETIDADDHITANYPSLLRQWENYMNQRKDEIEQLLINYTNGVARIYIESTDSAWVSGGIGYKYTIETENTNVVGVYRNIEDGFEEVMVGVTVNEDGIILESFEKFDGFVAVSATIQTE